MEPPWGSSLARLVLSIVPGLFPCERLSRCDNPNAERSACPRKRRPEGPLQCGGNREDNMNQQDQSGLLIVGLLCGTIAGAVCGLIAYAVAAWKKRQGLGIAALITCSLCGTVLGLLLAVPVAVVFIVVALVLGEPQPDRQRMYDDDD